MYELILEMVGKDTRWSFAQREIRVGRDPNCDLVLATDDYPMVSRSHLLIRLASDRYWAEDLNTPGGTFLNEERIRVSPLTEGDIIKLGVEGPQLTVHIGAARLSDAPPAPSRRTSSSAEAPTKFGEGTSPKHGGDIPTSKGVPGYKSTNEAATMIAFGPGRGEGAAPVVEDEDASEDTTVSLPLSPVPSSSRGAAEDMTPGVVSSPQREEPRREEETAGMKPSEAARKDDSQATLEQRSLQQETANMEKRLDGIRNLLFLIVILILILGGMMLYEILMKH